MVADSSLTAGIIFVILRLAAKFEKFREVKIIHRFCSSKGIFESVNIIFIFTRFLLFTFYYST